tara:strand:+ start:880 stop:1302 length:423 start_codon:yes stop_codon:yes gene_type:complete
MSSLLLFIIAIPILEVVVMIKIGQQIGAVNTGLLIFLTAIIGVYFAKIQGLNTLRSGFANIYKNKLPIFEIISGASIAIAAIFLIFPGFVTDTIGFILLFPFTRKIMINILFRKEKNKEGVTNENILDGEIVDDKKEKDE